MDDHKGQTRAALVTGAGGRLGQAMAIALAQAGYDVAVHYAQSADGATKTAEAITALGRRAVLLQADLLDEAAMQALVPRAVAQMGQLCLLINNASVFEHDGFGGLTRDSWDRHLDSNLRAAVVLTDAFAAQAPKAEADQAGEPRARAAIINMIDQRVWKPTPEFISYALAKSALWSFTKMSAQGLAPHIRVNAIGPGPTLRGGRQDADAFARQRAATILQRGANLDDITGAMLYLISAKAVTGQMIAVDGGQHLAWQTPDVIGTE